MVKNLIRKMNWSFWRRLQLMHRVQGFYASLFSFCSDSCTFEEYSQVSRGCVLVDVNLGRFSYLNTGSKARLCRIGAFCSIGQDVRLGGLGVHPKHLSTHPAFFSTMPPNGRSFHKIFDHVDYEVVEIGHDVWIGDRVMVLGGVSIGTGAIVAAGAIVTKDVEPYEIVAGVPARLIGRRFDKTDADALLNLKWWNWPLELLHEAGYLIGSDKLTELKTLAGSSKRCPDLTLHSNS